MTAVAPLKTTFFDAVYETLPLNLKDRIDVLFTEHASNCGETRHTFDRLLRFSLGRNHPEGDVVPPAEWNEAQSKLEIVLSNLKDGSSEGRKRGRDDHDSSEQAAKRTKLDITLPNGDGDDHPIYTLHAFSVTAPIRKKVDVTIHQHSIRFTNSTSGALESIVPTDTLTRACLVSTPGKTKAHYTIVLLSNTEQNQIIFGTDGVLPSLKTTNHPDPPQISPKGTSVEDALRKFLSCLPSHIPLVEPSTSEFRSGTGEPWLDTYLRAKEGHLFFFPSGVLFGLKKPCIWIGMEDIESVRSLTAIGRTFSIFIKRQPRNADQGGEEGEEREFSMIDGKHQDSVSRWVQDNQHLFGVIRDSKQDNSADNEQETKQNQSSKADYDESDDSDYQSESETDDGSASSASSSEGDGGSEEDEEDGSGEDEDGEGEVEDKEKDEDIDEPLDPSRHPLMAPGALPRLSKAAMDAVIGMVEQDLRGGTRPIPNGHEVDELGEDEDEEVDQLE